MKRMNLLMCLALAAPLCACTGLVENSKHIAESGTVAAHSTKNKIVELLTYRPPAPPVVPVVPPSYCYRVMQDINCYQEAVPGAEQRLVGYQASVLETGAPPPLPKMTVQTTVGEASPSMVLPPRAHPPFAAAVPPTPLTSLEVPRKPEEAALQAEKTQKSMAKYADTPPVFVGAPPGAE